MTQQLQIDISGRGGLGGDWYGYTDQTVPTPNTSYSAKQGSLVGGFFNPFTRPGYLFPSVATLTDLTSSVSTTMTTTLGASVEWQTVILALSPSGSSAPSVVAGYSASVEEASDTSFTKSFAVSSANINTYLIVTVTSKTGSNPTGVTYNGDTMSLAKSATDNGYVSIWYKSLPDTGTNDIVATWGSATAEKAIHAMTVTGVGNIGLSSKGADTSATGSATVTPGEANSLLILATASANATHTPGAGQTQRTNIASATTPFRYSTSTIEAINRTLTTSAVYDIKNNDYYLADEQHIFRGDGLDDTSLTTVLELGSTNTPNIMDMEIYQVNGVEKLFYVYETNDNLQVGISDLPYNDATDNPTWLTGTVTGAFTNTTTSDYNFIRTSDTKYAYLFADNTVHTIDGTTDGGANGTITEDVLVFPTYFRLYDAVSFRGNLYIILHQTKEDITTINSTLINNSTSCGIYTWNGDPTQFTIADYIKIEGVRAIKKIYVSPLGDIRIITISSDNMVQIRRFNGSSFEIIEELGLGAAPQYPDSLTVAGLLTIWTGTDGSVYAHGQARPGEPEALAKIGQIKEPSGDSSATIKAGAILYGGSNTYSAETGYRAVRQALSISYNDGSYTISKFYPFDLGTINSIAQKALQGNIYSPVTYLPELSTVEKLVVYMKPSSFTGSNTAGTIKIYFNQSTTAWATKTVTRDDVNRGYIDIPINKQYINAIQLEIEYPTATTLLETFFFSPSMAFVEYTSTNTKG